MTNRDSAPYRMLDANLNRAFEALRTLEDSARFSDLPQLQIGFKELRHQLHASSKHWDQAKLYQSRDALRDVGKDQKTEAESRREGGLQHVAAAAGNRLQQALRSIEELAKFLYANDAPAIEAVRYRVYDLSAKLQLSLQRDREFLLNSRLYVLVDCQLDRNTFVKRIREMSSAGVDLIQIRDKSRDARELIEYAQAAIEALDPRVTRIIMNDRADIAWAARCYGLHVGQTDLSVRDSRQLLPAQAVIGLSTHELEQLQAAVSQGVDYVGCGPTFSSTTKSFGALSGLEFLQQASSCIKEASIPGFAIGGITPDNLPQVLETGFRRVAVSAAVWKSESPAKAANRFLEQLVRV